ncbi:MAG: sodium-dependent transporter [Eubacteriales bacterium]|nr:sodium-dependent transporter [Eubacteriales bacterium]
MSEKKRSGFSGSLGFVFAAAGSAVGVGNIWRFPYLAAQDGGGLFLAVYLVLVLTFGFTLLVTDIAIGRRTGRSALYAFAALKKKWSFLGYLTFLVPAIIMTYYSVIGGWVGKYALVFLTGQGRAAAADGYFSRFISSFSASAAFMLAFLAVTAYVVYRGVQKGIERFASIVMPGLLVMIIGIAVFSLTLTYQNADTGEVRTGLEGFLVYVIPDLKGLTAERFLSVLLDAMSQLFFSLSVSMGIMITYGAYVPKEVDLSRSISQIEIFDTGVAFLAGMMIIPAVYVFFGTEGMASGPSLMFISLPRVFEAMGPVGGIVGAVFFVMVLLAALTSSVSIMETLVSNCMEIFHTGRKRICLVIGGCAAAASAVICMGYNVFYFELPLPNGQTAQLLDLADYMSNSFLMPLISLLTCIFIGWVIGPGPVCDEMEEGGRRFRRKKVYVFMIRYVAPVVMAVLFLQSVGAFEWLKSG